MAQLRFKMQLMKLKSPCRLLRPEQSWLLSFAHFLAAIVLLRQDLDVRVSRTESARQRAFPSPQPCYK